MSWPESAKWVNSCKGSSGKNDFEKQSMKNPKGKTTTNHHDKNLPSSPESKVQDFYCT